MQRANSVLMVAALFILGAAGCKKDETVAPVEETWVPDEANEPAAVTVTPPPEMSEEEKLTKAKEFYMQAEGKAGEGDWVTAVGLYEQAYYLVPAKHGFALKVAQSADKAGDCTKAVSYFEHFVQYADPEKYAADVKSSKKRLGELKKKGCE